MQERYHRSCFHYRDGMWDTSVVPTNNHTRIPYFRDAKKSLVYNHWNSDAPFAFPSKFSYEFGLSSPLLESLTGSTETKTESNDGKDDSLSLSSLSQGSLCPLSHHVLTFLRHKNFPLAKKRIENFLSHHSLETTTDSAAALDLEAEVHRRSWI